MYLKIADLYIRVSTDEQKDKGYSQRDQEERLRKYCDVNKVKINQVYIEDYSAKTFNRPKWQLLMKNLKKNKSVPVNQLLFTKWDRFSRNTADAYQMINALKILGVEAHAVEQPLDLSVPENKMMLAFYLAVPEVENDRRSLNVFYGMRRAKKEGRWMATAPIGYINKTSETGIKYITPHPIYGTIMKDAFEELAKGQLAINEIWRKASSKGLKCGKNQFWVSMRNPVYCGKLFIPRHLDEDAMIVQGQHQPIITELLFNEVQDVMDGRKTHNRGSIMSPEQLPLRGFLLCPICGRNLTGSPSKGKYKSYFYYHCISPCRFRINAIKANKVFEQGLSNLKPIDGMLDLYEDAIRYNFDAMVKGSSEKKRITKMDMEALNNKIDKIRELLINDQISPEDYGVIKKQLEEKIYNLKKNLNSFDKKQDDLNNLIKNLSNTLLNIEKAYFEAEIGLKREIIAAIFPEKLVYYEDGYRTPRLNEGVELICLINNELRKIKNETNSVKTDLSREVLPTRFELISMVPETIILSIELREHKAANIEKSKSFHYKNKSIFNL